MKKVLLATSVLALTTGFAAAEITLSGDARMGIIGGDSVDTGFTSRARVKFTLSGETDGGLAFGASFRADNASSGACTDGDGDGVCDGTENGADNGTAGEVFISGGFGKLTMGDIDGAAQSAVGQVSGVGLTGLGDLNEVTYIGAGSGVSDPTARYEYSSGAFTGYVSVTDPAVGDLTNATAVGVKYATDTFSVALGYEQAEVLSLLEIDHVIVGATGTFGAVTVKGIYGQADSNFAPSADQYALSVDYAADALTVTAFVMKDFSDNDRYGLGASYDLGGGASVVGGYADIEGSSAFDLGLSFSF